MSDTTFSDPSATVTDVAGFAMQEPLRRSVLLRGAPRVGRAHAALTRRVGNGLVQSLPMPGASLTLQLAGNSSAWSAPLVLAGAGGVIEISQGARLLQALTGIDLNAAPDDAGATYPEWLAAAVLGRLAGTPLAMFNRLLPGTPGMPTASKLQLSLRQQQHALAFEARADAAVWGQLLQVGQWTPLRTATTQYAALALCEPVVLGRHRLPAARARQLDVGDIVLPDTLYFAVDGSGALSLAGRFWQARFHRPGSVQLIALENRLETELAMQHPQFASPDQDENAASTQHQQHEHAGMPAQAAAMEDDALDDVPLQLSFELGRVSLSLAEIRALGPHSILGLHDGKPDSIAIVCGGRTVGRGEAVDVDGALGVRITQWGGPC